MKQFPDTSTMDRSKDGTEPIRGGSIGLNRILGMFEDAVSQDQRPRFNAAILSAFTIFRNVWTMNKTGSVKELEDAFVKDVDLFLNYYDTYLSHVWNHLAQGKFCPVVVYFPDYKNVDSEIEREAVGERGALANAYKAFMNKHGHVEGEMRRLEHCRCAFVKVGHSNYPHIELVRRFREITAHKDSLYTTGDTVCIMTHIPLDLYIASRLRGVVRIENNTARIRKPDEFKLQLDKQGRVPFYPSVHVVLGDDKMIKPMVSPKIKREVLEQAEKERWISRSEEDVRLKLSKITQIPVSVFKRYDFI